MTTPATNVGVLNEARVVYRGALANALSELVKAERVAVQDNEVAVARDAANLIRGALG